MQLPDSQLRRYWLGIDGGGTHTRAVLVETGPDAERTLGEGRAEAANLNRVGLEAAVKNVFKAVTEACLRAEVVASETTAACVGLAGVQPPESHRRMLTALKSSLPIAELTLETDARVALAGATDLQPGVVIIAGTGSISCGINARGQYVRAGGWGPTMGDEGSGHYIGKRALEAVMSAYDHRKPLTRLTDPVCRYLGVSSPPELPPVIYDSPGKERRDIAQLSKIVVDAGRGGDVVALEILNDAAAQLARAATTVINQLEMSHESFRVAYVGGVFDAGELILAPLRRAILAAAPRALLAAPMFPPVIGAVKLAQARHMVNLIMTVTEDGNPNTAQIDRTPTLEALRLINREDQEVALAVEKTLPAVAEAVDQVVARLKGGGRLFYVGTGTSGRLGVLDASEIPPTFGASPDLVQAVIAGGYDACHRAVEASEDDREAGARDLAARGVSAKDAVIGLAASGRTPYTIGAVAYARSLGALTACVTCNPGSEISQAVEIAIEPLVGPEVIAGSTRLKAGTAQKLVLNMISTMAMVRLGLVSGNRMSNLQPRNVKLRARAVGIVRAECGIGEERARTVLESAGWNLPVALVMERARVSSETARQALSKADSSVSAAVKLLTDSWPE